MSSIDLIKNSVSIIDVLEKYTSVALNGDKVNRKQFNVRCPFHRDRNPSFTVYTYTNTFRCWAGCNDGMSGDVIDIVKLSTGEDLKTSIKLLIADFGLKNPNSNQMQEWRLHRIRREQTKAIQMGLDNKTNEMISKLKNIEISVLESLSTIKSVRDLEHLGDLYHVLVQIEYWLDCLIETDPIIQLQTIEETEDFIRKIATKAR